MFSGLKKRVSSALQDGQRQLSETLASTYISRQTSTTSTAATGEASYPPAAAAAAQRTQPMTTTPSTKHYSDASSTTATSSSTTTSTSFPYGRLNPQAGCPLLGDAERDWQLIHERAEQNAERASQLDADIQQLCSNSRRALVTCSDLTHSLAGVPALCAQLSECQRQLADVRRLGALVEDALWQLEDAIDECALHDRKLQLRVELAGYQSRKMREMDGVRAALEREHDERRQQHERRLLSVQAERQQVFQEAFQADVRAWRETGGVPASEYMVDV